MARQNRVDPFGRIVAQPARGLLMGNRGCLHDSQGRIVRTSARDAWISCLPSWPGTRRPLMQPGHYTELFFLDEATAMAAGHRPCGSCRPDALATFKVAWQRAYGLPHLPSVANIDQKLRTRFSPITLQQGADLPDGAIMLINEQPVLAWRGAWLAWDFTGYQYRSRPTWSSMTLLTSPVMLTVLAAGYRPIVHPSADEPKPVRLLAASATVLP